MENKEEKTKRPRKMKDMMKGAFKEGMMDEMMKGLKRSIMVLLLAVIGWIVFVSLHSFFWSTGFTFYQNIIITFDALLVALVIAFAIIYKVSGLDEKMKKFKDMANKFTEDEE